MALGIVFLLYAIGNVVFNTYYPTFLQQSLGQVAPAYMPNAWTIHNAEALKKIIKIPVLGVNRITDPLMAEMAVSEGYP